MLMAQLYSVLMVQLCRKNMYICVNDSIVQGQ